MFASLLTALVPWLADLYLLSTVLLLIGLALIYVLDQPARRIVAAWLRYARPWRRRRR